MIFDAPIPFEEAIAIAKRKGLLPTSLTSAQLANLGAQLKQRAVFSARMDKAQVLQVLADNIQKIVSNQGIESEGGRLRSIPEAKSQLREALVAAGVPFEQPSGTRTIRDFYSDARRQLMIETNVLDTLGAGRNIAANDPIALMVNPGLELVRTIVPKGGPAAERDWHARWGAAYEELRPEDQATCTDGTDRMVALVNHPIWQLLGDGAGGYTDTLGNAWEPFAFNSGMTRIAVPREDCIALGILGDDEQVQPDDSIDINENLEASVAKFSGALQSQLAQTAGLQILDGVLSLIRNDARRRVVTALVRERLEAIRNSNPNHDSLGRFASGPATLSERDNIRRGRRAIERALRTKRTVRDAMMVKGLGTVHFVWGRPGTSAKNEKGASHFDGYGIAHIQAKRGDSAVQAVPVILARGRVLPHDRFPDRRVVQWKGWTAVLKKSNRTNSYVVTSIDADTGSLKNSGRLPGGQSALVEGGNRVGNPCPTRTPQLFAQGTAGASNAETIARSRARLKQIIALCGEAA